VLRLDSHYIRRYNCGRDTTYRSQRLSQLSPTAQRQAGEPPAHVTPYAPELVPHRLPVFLPLAGEVGSAREEGAAGKGRYERIPDSLNSTPMARKRKKSGRAKFRPPVRPPGTPGAPGVPLTQRSVPQARVGGDQALVRAVEMSLGARNQVVKGRGGHRVIESADPAIPLDRVPYFTKDLIRLLVVGIAMVVLLGAGSIAVPLIVK